MPKRNDRLQELDINLVEREPRVVTPPDKEDDGKDQCPTQSPDPDGVWN